MSFVTKGQTIIVNNYPKVVPQGKKWVLPTGQEILIELNTNAFQSGSQCNALLNSNPIILSGILEGSINNPNEVYSILLSELSKIAYSNEFTYGITPIRIIDSKFNMDELSYKPIYHVGKKQITFYPGQKVFVGACLQSIQLIEYTISTEELNEIKEREINKLIYEQKREEELMLAELRKKEVEEANILKLETERRQKVLNSSDYFNVNEISNKSQLRIKVEQSVLGILYEYIKDFQKQHPNLYEKKLETYKKKINNKSTDYYSMFNFSFCFDKYGQLMKVINSDLLTENADSNNLVLDNYWFKKLDALLSLNKSAKVKLDDKEYEVNSCFYTYFNFIETKHVGNIEIQVNKSNEISIIMNNSKLYNSEIISILKANGKSETFTKGKYLVKLNSESLEFKFIHFQNNEGIEILKDEKQINDIISISKL